MTYINAKNYSNNTTSFDSGSDALASAVGNGIWTRIIQLSMSLARFLLDFRPHRTASLACSRGFDVCRSGLCIRGGDHIRLDDEFSFLTDSQEWGDLGDISSPTHSPESSSSSDRESSSWPSSKSSPWLARLDTREIGRDDGETSFLSIMTSWFSKSSLIFIRISHLYLWRLLKNPHAGGAIEPEAISRISVSFTKSTRRRLTPISTRDNTGLYGVTKKRPWWIFCWQVIEYKYHADR